MNEGQLAKSGILNPTLAKLADQAYLKKEMANYRLKISVEIEIVDTMIFYFYGKQLLAIVLTRRDHGEKAVWRHIRPEDSKYPETCIPLSEFPINVVEEQEIKDGEIYSVVCGRNLEFEDGHIDNSWRKPLTEECWIRYLDAVGESVSHISTHFGIPKDIKPAIFIDVTLEEMIKQRVNYLRFNPGSFTQQSDEKQVFTKAYVKNSTSSALAKVDLTNWFVTIHLNSR